LTATYLFGDSFDLYASDAQMAGHWTNVSANVALSSTNRYGTGKSLNCNNGGEGASKTFPSYYTSILAMGDYMRTANNTSTCTIIFLEEDSVNHVELRHQGATGKLEVTRNNGTVSLGTSSLSLSDNTWYHIQFRAEINDSTGTAYVYVNGEPWMSLTGIDTRNGGTNGQINMVGFTLTGASNSALWDNVAVFSTTSSADMLTDIPRFYLSAPVSEGFQQDFNPSTGTDNSLTVDDVPTNSDTDYNSSSTTSALDLFNMGDLSITTGTILAVQSRVYARKEDSGTRTIAPIFRINSTNYVQTATSISNTYTWCDSVNTINPDTSAAWTISDINGLQAGYKIVV
jgi:hypothetical protein